MRRGKEEEEKGLFERRGEIKTRGGIESNYASVTKNPSATPCVHLTRFYPSNPTTASRRNSKKRKKKKERKRKRRRRTTTQGRYPYPLIPITQSPHRHKSTSPLKIRETGKGIKREKKGKGKGGRKRRGEGSARDGYLAPFVSSVARSRVSTYT